MKVKRMLYYKELSKIINKNINVMQFCNRKHNGTIKYYFYRESDELIENLFDHGCISCDAMNILSDAFISVSVTMIHVNH